MNKQTVLARLLPMIALTLTVAQPARAQQVKDPVPAAAAHADADRPIIVAQTTDTTTPPAPDDDIIVLSPFRVDSSREKGYFAENTLAGSRMRTNIADLGAAISVVTKQQLEDTASLDINDIFRYEIGTEGATTYTPEGLVSRGDGVSDAIAGANNGGSLTASTNATANRVRGLGSPSFAINYYQAIAQIPMDSYNISSIEINRGPNSLLFGMGSPAGIVNQSTAQALINKNTAQAQLRIDDRGSNRASLNFNKTLIRDTLAIYGAFLYNDQQYTRKPSYDITRRAYGAITYTPFKKTTLRASIEGYSNDNRRPNTLTPVDGVTEWRNATRPNGQYVGQPYYDSKTQTFYSAATGQSISMLAPSAASPNAQAVRDYIKTIPGYDPAKWNAANNQYNGISIFGTGAITNTASILYVPAITTFATRTVMQIADGQVQNWFQPLGGNNPVIGWNGTASISAISTTAGAANYVYGNPTWAHAYDTYQTESTRYTLDLQQPYFGTKTYPGVTDRAIYNWKKTNILEMNFGNQRNTNYNVELEQEILPELLHFSAGWFRQDFDSMQSYTVAQLNTTTLVVDTNKYLPDGRDNPYFGAPYVYDQEPDRMEDSWSVDQYRAMLAFTPDFTKSKGWAKWLGRHQILGMASYMDSERTQIRRRLEYAYGSQDGMYRYRRNPNTPGWNMQNTGNRRQFYLADAGSSSVTKASGEYSADPVSGGILVYDYAASQFKTDDMTMIWNVFDASTGKTQRTLNSYAAGWNGYLWNDRIITTLGVRRDINKTRGNTNTGMTDPEKWVDGLYQYQTVFKRWTDWTRYAGTTNTMGAVVKPFLHWDTISRRSGTNLFWEFVENFGVSFNKSDNFDAPTSTNVDLFGNVLPKPQGDGKDYGFQFSILKNKLFARVNWFESTNENTPYASNAFQRLWWHTDTTAYRGWLENIYMLNAGGDPSLDDWANRWTPNATGSVAADVAAMKAQVAQWWGLQNNYDYYDQLPGAKSGTRSTKAKGTELSINYNPLPNWTIKVTGAKVYTTNDATTKEFDAWYAYRSPTWDNATAIALLNPTAIATLTRLGGTLTPDGKGYTGFQISSNASSEKKGTMAAFWDSTNYRTAQASTPINSDSTDGWTTAKNYYNAVVTPNYIFDKDMQGQEAIGQRKYNLTLVTNYNFDRGKLKGWGVGGAQRWADKSIIGYYGKNIDPTHKNAAGQPIYDASDISRPIYDDALWNTDIWISYTRKIFNDKVRMKLQLNVADVFQDGDLKPVRVDWNGNPYAYRIVDSRQFILSATFDF